MHASNADRIEKDYREIAELVKIPGRTDPQNNILELVARWLRDEKRGRWLLVLDNADDDVVLSGPQVSASTTAASEPSSQWSSQLKRPLSAYLPQSANGALLVTTRTTTVAGKLVEPRDMITVEPMAKADAVTLLQKKLEAVGEKNDLEYLEELASVLEYMPLALVQAAAYIHQRGPRYSVQHYIAEFQRSDKRKTSLLNYEGGHLRRDPDAKNSIIVTWQISFTYIRERWPSSADLLALMSFFDRQGIPKEMLIVPTWAAGDMDEDQEHRPDTQQDYTSDGSSDDAADRLDEDIDRLRNYSFVSAGVDEQTFEMHGLVQLATQKWLAMQHEDERWRGEFCQRLNAVFPTGDYENWWQCKRLFPHAKAAERQRPRGDLRLREWSRILRNAGWYARARGNYIEAERMCKKSAQQLQQSSDKDDPHTLSSMANLASTYWNQGRWVEAEKMQVEMMETRRRVLGEEHPDTLTSMANLASTYSNQGRWTEAEKMEVEVMETCRRVLGEEHPDTLTSMANLAFTTQGQGRNQEAITLISECVRLRNRRLGAKHPSTLNASAALAEWQGR